MKLSNERLAFLPNDFKITINSKEYGKYEENGKCLEITTINDFIPKNDNEIASISAQESEITFWDLTTREINTQIGEIKNYGNSCMILFDKSLIVERADMHDKKNFIFVININNKELIKNMNFFRIFGL